MRKCLLLMTALAASTCVASAQQKSCEYAGQSFSVGATICECPSVKAQNVDWQGDNSHITSRRLICNADQTWGDSNTHCIDMTTQYTSKLYDKHMQHFCPRLPVNFAEIQKAVDQETAKFVEKAPKSTLVTMLEGICRRVKLEAQCKPLVDVLSVQ
ncbi:hypothetical protein ACVIHC_001833 [Bradyrhizobium diazoefficiens]